HEPQRHQLAEYITPGGFLDIGTDAEYAQIVVAPLRDPVRGLAAQYVDQVAGTKALAGAEYARQGLARRLGGIPGLRRLQAGIAIAAMCALFAEIVEQSHASAACGLAQSQQRFKLGERHATVIL